MLLDEAIKEIKEKKREKIMKKKPTKILLINKTDAKDKWERRMILLMLLLTDEENKKRGQR